MKNLYSLTKREIDVLKLVAKGYSNQEISQKLNIAYATAHTHLVSVYSKLQLGEDGCAKSVMRTRAALWYLGYKELLSK